MAGNARDGLPRREPLAQADAAGVAGAGAFTLGAAHAGNITNAASGKDAAADERANWRSSLLQVDTTEDLRFNLGAQ
jgi:hypothetical protein